MARFNHDIPHQESDSEELVPEVYVKPEDTLLVKYDDWMNSSSSSDNDEQLVAKKQKKTTGDWNIPHHASDDEESMSSEEESVEQSVGGDDDDESDNVAAEGDDDNTDYSKVFEKTQFEGKKGHLLLQLQKSYKGDDRF